MQYGIHRCDEALRTLQYPLSDSSGFLREGLYDTLKTAVARNTFALQLAVYLTLSAALSPVNAQPPAILQEGVRNEASRMPPSLPGGALSPGSRIVISGLRFPQVPYLSVRAGAKEWIVTAIEASHTQGVWQLPGDLAPGTASLILSNEDGESRPYPISITSQSGGIYSLNGQGWGPAHASRTQPGGGRKLIDQRQPAHAGEEIVLVATGSAKDFLLSVGGLAARARWVPSAAGRAELLVRVPPGAPFGCHVPVQLSYRGGLVGNSVTIPIAPPGFPCEPEKMWPTPNVSEKAPIGLLLMARFKLRIELSGQSGVDFTDEEAALQFLSPSADPTQPPPVEILPPAGTCVTFHGLYHQEFGLRQNLLEMIRERLPGPATRAGSEIFVEGPEGRRKIPRDAQGGGYFAFLGGERPDYIRAALPLFLAPGDYRVQASGGEDAGPFSVDFRMPPEFRSKSLIQQDSVTRRQGLRLAWTGGAQDLPIYVLAVSVRHSTTAFGACLCAAPVGQKKFTIPPEALANLPATEPESTMPMNLVFLISTPAPALFQSRGVSAGYVLPVTVLGRTMVFR